MEQASSTESVVNWNSKPTSSLTDPTVEILHCVYSGAEVAGFDRNILPAGL